MLLAYIIRNDKITFGVVQNGIPAVSASIGTDTRRTADEYAILLKNILDFNGISAVDFDGAICASVVPALTETLRSAVSAVLGIRAHIIGSGIKTGLTIQTENPAELGADLVATAVGALTKYAPPLVLIECGTAITFSYLNGEGAFLGCAIAPGLSLSARALSDAAGLLPDVAYSAPRTVLGKNTVESLRSGTLLATACMIDGMLSRIAKEHGTATVIALGEEADALLPHTNHAIKRDDTLTLLGLSIIYEKNKRPKKQS